MRRVDEGFVIHGRCVSRLSVVKMRVQDPSVSSRLRCPASSCARQLWSRGHATASYREPVGGVARPSGTSTSTPIHGSKRNVKLSSASLPKAQSRGISGARNARMIRRIVSFRDSQRVTPSEPVHVGTRALRYSGTLGYHAAIYASLTPREPLRLPITRCRGVARSY